MFAPSQRPAVIARERLTRSRLFFWLFLLATANALTGFALQFFHEHDFASSLGNLFGISAVVWVAAVAGIALLAEPSAPAPVERLDWAIAAMTAVAVLVPLGPASSVALTLLSLYAILTSAPGSTLRRAAIIFLAITGMLIWGRLALALFSGPLLDADSFLVASLFGMGRVSNFISFADGSGQFAVAPGCSSLQGMSVAIVMWALVNQWFEVPFSRSALIALLAALAVTIAINVLRIGAIGLFPAHFDQIHTGIGWHVFSWLTLISVAGICLYGARREIFQRA
jgi:exosortase/archaeosortase family protein